MEVDSGVRSLKKRTTPVRSHEHRKPTKKDFVGKTVSNFRRDADNVWRIWFTDGTSFAIQSEMYFGLPIMELCEVCADES